jgi:hypothetical protein
MLWILSLGCLVIHRNSPPIFKSGHYRQTFLINLDLDDVIISPSVICNHCKDRVAEIFQESGDYCLHCWQEITCPNV